MSIKDDYYIKKVDYQTAINIVIKNHYLHRKAPCSFAFGLFEKNTNLVKGIIVYGTPSSPQLRKGICGNDERYNVLELTRLWVDDNVPKNGESFLIGNTLKLVDKEIIVSYAEAKQGHLGIVYQATNWLYTGTSHTQKDWVIEGLDIHGQTLSDKYSVEELKKIYGNKLKQINRPPKFRYIYFNCNKIRKKELLKKLNYNILPYPKQINCL